MDADRSTVVGATAVWANDDKNERGRDDERERNGHQPHVCFQPPTSAVVSHLYSHLVLVALPTRQSSAEPLAIHAHGAGVIQLSHWHVSNVRRQC